MGPSPAMGTRHWCLPYDLAYNSITIARHRVVNTYAIMDGKRKIQGTLHQNLPALIRCSNIHNNLVHSSISKNACHHRTQQAIHVLPLLLCKDVCNSRSCWPTTLTELAPGELSEE